MIHIIIFTNHNNSIVAVKFMEKFQQRIVYTNKIFIKILDFYLFRCPVEGGSVKAKTFKDYGFEGQRLYSKLKSRMLNIEGSEVKERYYPCTKQELDVYYEIYKSNKSELCIFLKHDEKLVMQSLFKAIRNSFAHGSFYKYQYKNEHYYYFENVDGYKKAQIQLKEKTLLKWIECIEEGVL